jgi:hypothetical protein
MPARARDQLKSVAIPGVGEFPLRKPPGGLDTIFRTIAEEAGPAFAVVADGLVEALLGEAATPARVRAAAALVRLAARRTGFIEICGAPADGEIFLQGWANDLPSGRTRVLAVGEPPAVLELSSLSYERDDLGGRGKGFAGLLEAPQAGDPSSITQLLFRGPEGWRAIDIYERRRLMHPREIPAHVRTLLTRASGPDDIIARFRRSAHRFDGRETVSQLQEPVRVGIDLAVRIPGGGILLAGWLLDPKDRVRAVRLRSGKETVVIGNDWTRLPRADVANAYANDPLFRDLVDSARPTGFLALARLASRESTPAHLELDLGENLPPTFFPLSVADVRPRQALARLLQCVDSRSAAAHAIVERQFGPMLRSLERVPSDAPGARDIGAYNESASLSLVVGFDDKLGEALSLLALIARDPVARSLPIVLAAPSDAIVALDGEIRRLASFYRLSLRLAEAASGSDVYDSLEAGVHVAATPAVALLAGHVVPTAGWLEKLADTFRRNGDSALVSPTVLFEDGSLRWAGAWLDEHDGRRELVEPHVGYPRGAVTEAKLQQVAAGTLDCCILPRAALLKAGGFSAGYLGAAAKNIDLALRIRMGGTQALWEPAVTVTAADEPSAGGELMSRIDRWSFDHRWSLPLAAGRAS